MSAEFTHSPTPEEIMEYLDGEGAPASRDAIAAHLATCGTCQAVAADLRGVSQQAQTWTVNAAPASLQAPPPTRTNVLSFRAWRPSRIAMGALGVAAAILIVVSFGAREARTREPKSVFANMPAAAPAVDAIAQPQRPGAAGGVIAGNQQRSLTANAPEMNIRLSEQAGRSGPRTPAVIRTARLQIVVKDFTRVRSEVESLVSGASGFIDHMTVTGDTSSARTLRGTLRVPADRMAAVLGQLRAMGQVVEDTQGSQDVTDQIVDLDARMASARATETRLVQLIRERTGRLSDVLEVERELTRVRLDIERLMAEKTNLDRRVSYTTIDVTMTEERKATLDGPLSFATRLRIAAADGVEAALDLVAGFALFVLRAGPTLVLLGMVFGIAWLFGRRILKPASR